MCIHRVQEDIVSERAPSLQQPSRSAMAKVSLTDAKQDRCCCSGAIRPLLRGLKSAEDTHVSERKTPIKTSYC